MMHSPQAYTLAGMRAALRTGKMIDTPPTEWSCKTSDSHKQQKHQPVITSCSGGHTLCSPGHGRNNGKAMQMESSDLGIAERLGQRIGRPSRVRSMSIRFTRAEEQALTKLAQEEGLTVREWAREALLNHVAPKHTETAIFTEVVALRMLIMDVLRPRAAGQQLTPEAYGQILAEVRTKKHQTAIDVLAQYQNGDK